MNVLVVVDMQNDFIDGSLGTKEAQAIVPLVAKKIRDWDGPIISTFDTHGEDYLETQEGKKLPVLHCQYATHGWKQPQDILDALGSHVEDGWNDFQYDLYKETFASKEMIEVIEQSLCPEDVVESFTLVGLCTDICVISNAMLLKAYFPEAPIFVDAACCAGVTPDSHETALKAMSACQINIKNKG